jgi:hypothetical protein
MKELVRPGTSRRPRLCPDHRNSHRPHCQTRPIRKIAAAVADITVRITTHPDKLARAKPQIVAMMLARPGAFKAKCARLVTLQARLNAW